MYKKTIDALTLQESESTIIRKSDNAFIPKNLENKDYQEYLEWVAEGNTIADAD